MKSTTSQQRRVSLESLANFDNDLNNNSNGVNKSKEEAPLTLASLQERFRAKDLEDLYGRYEQRARVGAFSAYLGVQAFLSTAYVGAAAVSCAVDDECSALTIPKQLPELLGHSALLALSVALLLFVRDEGVFKRRPFLVYVVSAVVAVSIEIVDVALCIYYWKEDKAEDASAKVPVLSLYNHLIIYLFLPIPKKGVALIFGFGCTLVCMVLYAVFEPKAPLSAFVAQFFADLIFLSSLNLIGFYLRYVGEINLRRGFLDKRGCIDATFKLKYEKEQEENLLLSIIPKHMATQVRESIIAYLKTHGANQESRRCFSELFVEKHEDVSILFADICNFTPLTTRLPVDKLVETLNDLFGKFDEAAERRNCMRIKILGDCYYCVSGVPDPDPEHAVNCVEMGLEMIEAIKSVRMEHGVDVDMRIGVHSGYILSGILGNCKWQYDVWSKDVTIANRMESTGAPGAVHITEKTKTFLGDKSDAFSFYAVEKALDDETLRDLKTFLIYPTTSTPIKKSTGKALQRHFSTSEVSSLQRQRTPLQRRVSLVGGVQSQLSRRYPPNRRCSHLFDDEEEDHECEEMRRRSLLMDSGLKNFRRMMDSAGEFMRDEIDKLPLRKYDQWLHPDEINPRFLWFRDKTWERPYAREHDPLFKFYAMAAFLILVAMVAILGLVSQHNHLPLSIEYAAWFASLATLLPCLWVAYVWDRIVDPHFEASDIIEPDGFLVKLCYRSAKRISANVIARTAIFGVVVVLAVGGAVVDLATASCLDERPKYYTFRCALALTVVFVFLRVHHLLKVIACVVFLVLYGVFILGTVPSQYGQNVFSTEYFGYGDGVNASVSHFLFLAVIGVFFIVMDRQHEYMHRLDFQWKRQLKREQDQANVTKFVNKMLLLNILPLHVANVYLANSREVSGRLYSESHENVAVMFASVPGFLDFFGGGDVGVECVKTLHEIIAAFDKLLFEAQFSRVEKIKVIGATYMAACGLRRDSADAFGAGANARTMAKFAAAMIRELAALSEDFQLRVGLNVGAVIAGVVGAQKPLYDIWSDTVNVASRMEYAGSSGKIQVPEATAKALNLQRVACTFRDEINVKGKGLMRVYFVDLDEEMFVVERFEVFETRQEQRNVSVEVHDEEETRGPEDNYKKDSGYGSQGVIQVGKIRIEGETEEDLEGIDEEDENEEKGEKGKNLDEYYEYLRPAD